MRKLVSLTTILLVVLGTGFGPEASPALATSGCTVSIALPKTLKLTSTWTSYSARVESSPQGCAEYAKWDLVRADGAEVSSLLYNGPYATSVRDSYHWSDGAGVYQAYGDWGYDLDSEMLTPLDGVETMQVKFASKVSLKVKPNAANEKHLVFSGKAMRIGTLGSWQPWKTKVKLQRKVHGAWKTIKSVRSKSNGKYAIDLSPSSSKSSWRVKIDTTSKVWSSKSSTKRK